VVFDSRGTVFNNITAFLTQPFAKGWSYTTSTKTWNSADALFFYKGTTPGYLKLSDALVRVTLATNGVKMVQEQGSFRSDRSFHVQGFNNGAGLTNWTEVVVNDGDFIAPLKLRANSRFYFNSNGSFGSGNILNLLPNADNSGDNFGGGRAELYWSAGTNTSNYIGMQIGAFGGADAYLAMSGMAYFHRGGTGSGTDPSVYIASGTASNSSPTAPVRGEMVVSGTAGVRVLGRNDSTSQYGNLFIACQSVETAVDATGFLTVKDDAFVWLDKGRIRIASSEGARGYLTVEGRGVVKALGTQTAKLAAENIGIRLGGEKSKEAVVTIRDAALIETPRVAATDASFIRNALVLEGGTLKTSKIEGSALDVVVSGGTIQARTATTSAAPLIAGDLHAWTFTGEKRLTIDTQEFDTYIDAAFPSDAIIVKKGSGTLYVKNSTHAKTIVEEGGIVMTTSGGVFGQVWEVGEDVKIPVPTVASSQDVVLMNFTTEAAANAYAALFDGHAARVSGQRAGSATVTKVGDVWQVVSHVEVTAAGKTLTWVGAAGSKWVTPASWNPADIPEPDDVLTVSGDASMELPRFGYAHALNLPNLGTLTLSGAKGEIFADEVNVTGDKSSKIYEVPAASSATITTPGFQAEEVGFKKTGAGELTLDFREKKKTVYISSNATDSIRINAGTLTVKGAGSLVQSAGHIGNEGTCFYYPVQIGEVTTPANASAKLVLDHTGYGRADLWGVRSGGGGGSMYVGYFYDAASTAAGATASLVMQNGALFCSESLYVGYRSKVANTTAIFTMTNSTAYFGSNSALVFGQVESAAEETTCAAVVARIGAGAKISDASGGKANGSLQYGCNLDVAFEDGATVAYTTTPAGGSDWGVIRGWMVSDSRAFGEVRFTRGASMKFAGGLCFNNFATQNISPTHRLCLAFDGGVFIPAVANYDASRDERYECRTVIFHKPEYQGFEARAGGMRVDMSACSRYTIAAPVRGVGELVKMGAGTLVLGKGLAFAPENTYCEALKEPWLTNTTRVVTSGVVTVQNAGGVHVAEGSVEVESGATDMNSTFTVDADCAVDLAGNTVELGMLKGAGVVRNGTIAKIQFKPLADGETAAELTDVAVNKAYVDFAGVADPMAVRTIARLGANVTGVLSGTSFRLKARNTGLQGYTVAECTVDDDGVVTAKAVPSGLMLLVR